MPKPQNRLLICTTCTRPTGAQGAAQEAKDLRDLLHSAGLDTDVAVETHACLGACARPVCMALQGAGRASYVFADLAPEAHGDDIIALCRAYIQADLGWIEDARPLGALRHHLLTRLPALQSDGKVSVVEIATPPTASA